MKSTTTRSLPVPLPTARARGLHCLVVATSLTLATLGLPTTGHAGDILRGGATAARDRQNATARANSGAEAAELARRTATDRLAKTTRIIESLRRVNAPAPSNIPNGLVPGGLVVANPASWVGALLPTQNGSIVNIVQTAPVAQLYWESFNVGRSTILNFDQSAGGADVGKWIAFNRVLGPTPSRIAGIIRAPGQVYVENPVGITFESGARIQARTFVATTLPLNNNLIAQGLLNNRDAQFLMSALSVPGGSDGTPEFIPPPPPASGRFGDIVVQAGALLSGPTSADGNGGRIMLVAANITNNGVISTPAGQTILAAGLQVGVRAHRSDDPSLRGLDVWVGDVGNYAGRVTNNGLIESRTGSITIVGRQIEQLGALESSTSVTLNGRIDILASYGAVGNPNFDRIAGSNIPPFINQFTGSVFFGPDSVTRILPDLISGAKIPGARLPERSQINIEGFTIRFGPNAIVLAPGGNARLRAGVWPYKDVDGNRTTLNPAGNDEPALVSNLVGDNQRFAFTGGSVTFEAGSLFDVSGTTAAFVPLTQHILQVQLRGSELADSPLLRNSTLRGLNLIVDIRRSGVYGGREWFGTPLGDLSGLLNIIERDAAQLTAGGGDLSIQAGGSIVIARGATLDVSGGFMINEGGRIQTTRLMRGPHIIPIDRALPNVTYDQIYTGQNTLGSAKWGVSKTYSHALAPTGAYMQREYIEGAPGGTISLIAPNIVVEGELIGRTIKGPRQQESPPKGGTLKLAFRNEKLIELGVAGTFTVIQNSPTPPDLFLANPSNMATAEAILSPSGSSLGIGTNLFAETGGGFANLEIDNRDGDFTIPVGTKVNLPAGGSLTVRARNVNVLDDIRAPGGTIAFTAFNFSPFLFQELTATGALVGQPSPPPQPGRGIINVAEGVTISVAGNMVDDRPTSPEALVHGRLINGGDIILEAYSILLASGSLLDASGGIWAKATGGFTYGTGGNISVLAGKDPEVGTIIGGNLQMDGTVQAYSGRRGGSITLQSNLITITDGPTTFGTTTTIGPDFFRKGGFTSYNLIGIGAPDGAGGYLPGIRLTAGTVIEPVSESHVLSPFGGPGGTMAARPYLKPVGLRPPASVSLRAVGADDLFTENFVEALGVVLLEQGSVIRTDPGGSVTVQGDTVAVLGTIEAPGGSITITGRSSFRLPQELSGTQTLALPTVFIGPSARLSTAGTTVFLPDPFGRRAGIIYPGGSITVSGNIIASAGAVLDVSGTSSVLDFHPTRLAELGLPLVPRNAGLNSTPWGRRGVGVRVDTDGGRIELIGGQFLYSDATLIGRAGGPTALGGTLAVSSGRFYTSAQDRTSADINLIVEQSGSAAAFGNIGAYGDIVALMSGRANLPALFASGSSNPGIGYFAIQHFSAGGFDNLDLGFRFNATASPIPFGGNVEFRGPVTINARGFVRLAGGGVVQSDSPVVINAPYVAIGQEFRPPLNPGDPFVPFQRFIAATSSTPPFFFPPTAGQGTLSINARHIDLGTLSLQGISSAILTAQGGDIRGSGTVQIAGDLTLRAGQVYPTTLATFNIFAYDHAGGPGSVTILQSGTRPAPPLSAGGSINIYASTITQAGTLRAPFGAIRLGWDGTDLDPDTAGIQSPVNPLAGTTLPSPTANLVTLASGSLTSTSGAGLLVPFGISPDGLSWIDPRGVNITVSGLPEQRVRIAGNNIVSQPGSVIDIRGGGDLFSFRWVPGTGGSADILGQATSQWGASTSYRAGDLVLFGGQTWSARVDIDPSDFARAPRPEPSRFWALVPESFAILPGFSSPLAPFNPFNTGPRSGLLGGDPGFVQRNLRIGEQVFLQAGAGLPAGAYTLLPRRYALLPGAYLIVPQNTSVDASGRVISSVTPNLGRTTHPIGTALQEEGASFVSGYTFNAFNNRVGIPGLLTRFEVVPPAVLANRAEYQVFTADEFLSEAARRLDVERIQRLPRDSGYLSFSGNTGLSLSGQVLAASTSGGRGGIIDITSFSDIYVVGGTGAAPGGATAVLNAGLISNWGAESLLIGGLRRQTPAGTAVQVRSTNIVLDTPGSALRGADVTLASREQLTMTAGSSLLGSGIRTGRADNFLISGDGTLLRVSTDPNASVTRTGLTGSVLPLLTIGADSLLSGRGVIIESTYASDVDPTTRIQAYALTLASGQISILLEPQASPLPGAVVIPHLELEGLLRSQAEAATRLTLLSYRTIDIYGDGTFGRAEMESLRLLGGGIRGFARGPAGAVITAQDVFLGNPNSTAALPAPPGAPDGSLTITSSTLRLGPNDFAVSGYGLLTLEAQNGILAENTGSLLTANDLTTISPLISGRGGAAYTFDAGGDIALLDGGGDPTLQGGLGAALSFRGASINAASRIFLPSGSLELRARTGALNVSGNLSVEGSSRSFYDLIRYADAGQIELIADVGDISLLAGSTLSVAADPGGGNAGRLIVRAPGGAFSTDGTLLGQGGSTGLQGSFLLDAGALASYADLRDTLSTGGFTEEQNLRIRTGNILVDGTSIARKFSLSADGGSILVTGTIDASGLTGGSISLVAADDLTLAPTALLTVAAQRFSNAGKGGAVHLEAGAAINAVANAGALLDLQAGSTIDLSVADFVAGDYLTPGSSAFRGQFEGTLHLRAPRTAADVRVGDLSSTLVGGSAVLVEGFQIYTPAGGILNIALRDSIHADNAAYIAAAEANITTRLLGSAANAASLAPLLVVAPGVEIANPTGDLTLGLANLTGSANPEAQYLADWDLSGWRYGTRSAPGVLTLRAQGDVVFNNTLSDGFNPITIGSAAAFADQGHSRLWLGTLMPIDTALPTNLQSWSYRIAAGSDLAAADFRSVLAPDILQVVQPGKGSVLVGEFHAQVPNTASTGTAAAIGGLGQTADTIRISTSTTDQGNRYEVVRTGTGDILVSAGRDVQLRNQFASIYTAGVAIPERTRIFQAGDFLTPIVVRSAISHPGQGPTLGTAIQQSYEATYAMSGGNLQVSAGRNIGRYTLISGQLVADSSRQIPTNWLYRRGSVDPATGLFSEGGVGTGGLTTVTDPSASTTWWVDYSNFFQGFGALAGGDISLFAENDLVNADALIPTNARMAGRDPGTGLNIAPNENLLLEHGGGDLTVRAGRNIDGGNYYVEKGQARIFAGEEITTNQAQSPSRGYLASNASTPPEFFDPLTWQALTLYGGRSTFEVAARGNILLGPMTSAFLLPQGLNNKFWYKTQFQTIGAEAGVDVASFGGSVTHRLAVTVPGDQIALPTLITAYRQTQAVSPSAAGFYRPWLRIAESNIDNYRIPATVGLPSLRSTAFAGDINVVGTLNLFPSPQGALELVASGGIIGINATGRTTATIGGVPTPVTAYASASVNLSDANPARAPGVASPLSFQQVVNSREISAVRDSIADPFLVFSPMFRETGSFTGVNASIDAKASLHATTPIHANNPDPVRLYATGGDITGLTLFTPKKLLAYAERDITDIAFYLQHVSALDISIVSAGRDIIPFNENSPLRSFAGDIDRRNIIVDPLRATVLRDATGATVSTRAMAGDIQIGGAGFLEVLAGRNIDLGTGANFVDGTGTGITSIGRSRNPFLAFEGADLIVLAGVTGPNGGPALGLANSSLNLDGFGNGGSTAIGDTEEHRAIAALADLFALLRRVGNEAALTNDYSEALAAVSQVFGDGARRGSITTRARDIRTTSGGNISILAPNGDLTLASDIFGNPLTPPGIVTEFGGSVNILTGGDVNIGQARIFTLRGGDLTIWSTAGDIAAGSAPKTVVSAPPTRVVIDATSGDIQTDLGGLATGGGIGVLAAVEGIEPGSVFLIAPQGTVDAGDAGIRATGNIQIAATEVLNADNISAGGTSTGVPAAPAPAAANVGGLSSAGSSTAATSAAAAQVSEQARPTPTPEEEQPSVIEVEVLGYGGEG